MNPIIPQVVFMLCGQVRLEGRLLACWSMPATIKSPCIAVSGHYNQLILQQSQLDQPRAASQESSALLRS